MRGPIDRALRRAARYGALTVDERAVGYVADLDPVVHRLTPAVLSSIWRVTAVLTLAEGSARIGEAQAMAATTVVLRHRDPILGEGTGTTAATIVDRFGAAPVPAVPAAPDPDRGDGIAPVDWAALFAGDTGGGDFLIDPLLARGRGHALVGAQKTGKSLLGLFLAASVASGRRCLHRPAGDPVPVVYIDAEMTEEDLRDRLEDMGMTVSDLDLLAYYLRPDIPPLDTAPSAQALTRLLDRHRPALVVLDTVASLVEGPENDADTFRRFARHAGRVLRDAGVTWLRIDHLGKDPTRGARGSSAKADDVDVVALLKPRERGALRVEITRQRPGWLPPHVDLVQLDGPLRWAVATGTWPEGTAETARVLDTLGVPLDASGRAAQRALRDAGEGRRRDVVLAALRYRRDRAGNREPTREPPREPPRGEGGNRRREPVAKTPENQAGTTRGTGGNRCAGASEPGSPPIGGTGSGAEPRPAVANPQGEAPAAPDRAPLAACVWCGEGTAERTPDGWPACPGCAGQVEGLLSPTLRRCERCPATARTIRHHRLGVEVCVTCAAQVPPEPAP